MLREEELMNNLHRDTAHGSEDAEGIVFTGAYEPLQCLQPSVSAMPLNRVTRG